VVTRFLLSANPDATDFYLPICYIRLGKIIEGIIMNKSKIKVWIYVAIVSLLLTSLLPLVGAQAAMLDKPQVSAGSLYTIGLRQDGTVVGTGDNGDGQRNVGDWGGIVYVGAGTRHTVGVYQNGAAVATGRNIEGQCNVGSWSNISQVALGWAHTAGLKKDGTVVAVGANKHGELNVGSWSNIVQIAADDYWSQGKRISSHTIGVKKDGTVVAVGANTHGQLDVDGWTDIVQVACGGQHTVGLKKDGTVVAVGNNEYGKINVSGWTNIVYVAAGDFHTLGVKDNGRVVSVGANFLGQRNVGGWRDIIQVDGGRMHSAGVKLDGTVVATGLNRYGQCNVSSWDLTSAYDQGYKAGYQAGYNAGYQEGRDDGYEWGYQDAKLETDIQAIACRLGEPPPSEDGAIREINLDIRFENQGCGDAFDAWAYVIDCPSHMTVTQPFVYIGEIPAGGSTWSDNPLTIRVDTSATPAPGEGIVWYLEYMDANYNYRAIEDLIQFINAAPPVADIGGPYASGEGETFTLDASGSYDPDDDIALYEWDLDDDGEYDDATGVTTTAAFEDNGVYTIGLKVTDGYGDYDTDSTSVTVDNLPPEVSAGPDQALYFGDTFSVNAEFTDSGKSDTHIATIYWGDGSSETGTLTEPNEGPGSVTGNHDYTWCGNYSVTIEVTDDDGDMSSDECVVDVMPVPEVMVETLSGELGALELPAGIAGSLDASLDTAAEKLLDSNPNNDVVAINALEAFINELEAQRDKKIPGDVVDSLITKVQETIAAIGGGA
jgi:hypothetical protein